MHQNSNSFHATTSWLAFRIWRSPIGWRFAASRRANDFGTLPNGLKGHEHGMEDVGEILG